MSVRFPFSALVGLDTLKLALQLAAIDRRLSVVVRGDKGAGKSTAARGLAALLDAHAPFVTLPIGATEDRLLGGLDVEKALKGEPTLKRGLLAEAHGGVLYVDEVNLLPDHLADALLDAAASGVHTVEREGFSLTQPADFVLLGTMNPEEGALRPQLLDRFALAVDVQAPADVEVRCAVLYQRLAFDRDPQTFVREWAPAQERLGATLSAARAGLASIAVSRAILHYAASQVAASGVLSLRADLAVVNASRALAALEGASAVTEAHVDTVLPLALAHRTSRAPSPMRRPPEPPSSPPPPDRSAGDDDGPGQDDDTSERVFAAAPIQAPRLIIEHQTARAGSAATRTGLVVGPVVATRQTPDPGELDVRATLLHAVATTGAAAVRVEDLHERVRAPRASTRFILVVDSSGSHAVQDRMRLVKGAIAGLLDASYGRHDEVVVIACRGAAADVLLEPTSSRADAERAVEYLPTGGRTPLAHGLELAAGYATDHAIIVLVTDGHANVATRTEDAWADALSAAGRLSLPALVIDTEDARQATGRPAALAAALGGRSVPLAQLDQADVVRLARELA
jgi:magnesium chelatase subunit D